MHPLHLFITILVTLTLQPSILAQTKEIYCGAFKSSLCPKGTTCVRPAPNVRCMSAQMATCPGICKPSCSIPKTNSKSQQQKHCPYNQICIESPPASSQSSMGFCPDPVFCGGIAGIRCEDPSEICVDDPRDKCVPEKGGADCSGICVPASSQPGGQQCGAKTGKTCPAGYDCQENKLDDCDPKKGFRDCPGICVKKVKNVPGPTDQTCGGVSGKKCAKGYVCFDNPKDGCDPKKGGAGCSGLCVRKSICATLSGIQCPEGQKCVADVDSDCTGGIAADCPGVCV